VHNRHGTGLFLEFFCRGREGGLCAITRLTLVSWHLNESRSVATSAFSRSCWWKRRPASRVLRGGAPTPPASPSPTDLQESSISMPVHARSRNATIPQPTDTQRRHI